MRPSRIHFFARIAAGVNRWFRFVARHSPFSLAFATISFAFGTSLESGFSHSTWHPYSSACIVGRW